MHGSGIETTHRLVVGMLHGSVGIGIASIGIFGISIARAVGIVGTISRIASLGAVRVGIPNLEIGCFGALGSASIIACVYILARSALGIRQCLLF